MFWAPRVLGWHPPGGLTPPTLKPADFVKPKPKEARMTDNAGADARAQATEYDSPFADRVLRFDDGTTMMLPPHPNLRMLDDDALEAYEAYLEEIETYDREPDLYIPEQRVKDRDGNEMVLPAEIRPGPVKGPPYYRSGKRVSPPREVRVVQVVLGLDAYEVLRAKQIDGRKAGARDVWRAWNEQGFKVAERAAADSKSDGRPVVLEDVPPPDSQ